MKHVLKSLSIILTAAFAVACIKEVPYLNTYPPDSDGGYTFTITCDDIEGMEATKADPYADLYKKITNTVTFIYRDGVLSNGPFFCDEQKIKTYFTDDSASYDIFILGNVNDEVQALYNSNPAAFESEAFIDNLRLSFPDYDKFETVGFPMAKKYIDVIPGTISQFSLSRLVGFYTLKISSNEAIESYTVNSIVQYCYAKDVQPFATESAPINTERKGLALTPAQLAAATSEDGVRLYFLENIQGELFHGNTDMKNKTLDLILEDKIDRCTYLDINITKTDIYQITDSEQRQVILGYNLLTDCNVRRNTQRTINYHVTKGESHFVNGLYLCLDVLSFGGLPVETGINTIHDIVPGCLTGKTQNSSEYEYRNLNVKYIKYVSAHYDISTVDFDTITFMEFRDKWNINYNYKTFNIYGCGDQEYWDEYGYDYSESGRVGPSREAPFLGIKVKINNPPHNIKADNNTYWAILDGGININGKYYVRLEPAKTYRNCYCIDLYGNDNDTAVLAYSDRPVSVNINFDYAHHFSISSMKEEIYFDEPFITVNYNDDILKEVNYIAQAKNKIKLGCSGSCYHEYFVKFSSISDQIAIENKSKEFFTYGGRWIGNVKNINHEHYIWLNDVHTETQHTYTYAQYAVRTAHFDMPLKSWDVIPTPELQYRYILPQNFGYFSVERDFPIISILCDCHLRAEQPYVETFSTETHCEAMIDLTVSMPKVFADFITEVLHRSPEDIFTISGTSDAINYNEFVTLHVQVEP